ncbi:hypothetical protein EIP75_07080 [Aquabacterium soli]|jgi:hypothetical protein|uniref:Uncharacterized protein n=1 Tax=Aquabacterium soli TaxID=2493092 RepID=A0A426VEI3_9BURK|nr:hypothetical protein [Aquabacterium soli]RRS05303.1 hypothetical protein EIP75_07080 [Aquabacterium soli]
MKLQLLHVTCAQCGRDSHVGVMPEGIHGQFVLRSTDSLDEAFLDTATDPTYEEVDALLNRSRRMIGKDDWFRAHALQRTYGETACDPDSTGSFFRIGKLPNCPLCGHASLHSWKALSPPAFIDREIAPVSHRAWLALSEAQKEFRVDDVLEDNGF